MVAVERPFPAHRIDGSRGRPPSRKRREASLSDVRCVAQSGDELGEGPVWAAAEGRLCGFDGEIGGGA